MGKIKPKFRLKKEAFYLNAKGVNVPLERMNDINVLKEFVAKDLCKKAAKLSEMMGDFRAYSFEMMKWYAEKYQQLSEIPVPSTGKDRKGYKSVTSYDGLYRAEISQQPYYIFGEGFQVAKALMYEIIKERTDDTFLLEIINSAFSLDEEGQVKQDAIMSLCQYKVDDPRWTQAVDILLKDRQESKRKAYCRFQTRENEKGEFRTIPLDIAQV